MFYDWSECVVSVLGSAKHSSCNQRIEHLAINLCCIVKLYCVLYAVKLLPLLTGPTAATTATAVDTATVMEFTKQASRLTDGWLLVKMTHTHTHARTHARTHTHLSLIHI